MSEQLDLFSQPLPLVITTLTFDQAIKLFVEFYWKGKKSYIPTKTYLDELTVYLSGRQLHSIGRQDIHNLRSHLSRRGVGPSGLNKPHMILTLLLNKFEEWREDGWLDKYDLSGLQLPRRNPGLLVKRLKEPPRHRFIKPLEFRAYYKIATELGFIDIAKAIRFGIWAHLAPIDLFGLNDSEIDESAWQIRVYRRHTKTDQNPKGSLQVIELTERMWAELERIKRFRRPDETRYFNIINRRKKLAKIRKIAKERGYPDFTWLDLRKAGSGYLHGKVPREVRAHMLGHSDPRVTDRHYTPPGNPLAKEAQLLVQEAF